MRGRPILGVISGFMFGLFLGISLFLWGAIPFHSPLLWILPIVGIVLGLILAAWAPFGRNKADSGAIQPEAVSEHDGYATSVSTDEAESADLTEEE